jgi:CheY-like chemotaxis protein
MPRVLVIDDQADVRETISIALKAKGFDVVAVESGRLGLIELNKTLFDVPLFDLAIVDIYMPEMDGVKLIKAMRERTPNLPVIAISGVFLPASGRTVLDILPTAPNLSGITCLQKPFRPQELLQAIQKVIGVAA